MEIYEQIDLNDCGICGGVGCLEEEAIGGYYVACMDCGSHSVLVRFNNDEERLLAAKTTAELWNCGKVILSHPGE